MLLLIPWVSTGCSSGSSGSGAAVTEGGTPLTFDLDIAPSLRTTCGPAACHSYQSKAGGLELDGSSDDIRKNLVSVRSTRSSLHRVEPGDPDRSFLTHKLSGHFDGVPCPTGCGSPMPLTGSLDATVRDQITTWIADGAGL